MSRGTYLRSTVSFWASQLRRRVLNLDAACLSVPAATGGNALINTGSPSACRSVSLMILVAPALPSPPRGAHWLMSGSQWCFHIDTSIDDGAPGTSHIDQLESDRPTFQSVLRVYFWIRDTLRVGYMWWRIKVKYGVNVIFPVENKWINLPTLTPNLLQD